MQRPNLGVVVIFTLKLSPVNGKRSDRKTENNMYCHYIMNFCLEWSLVSPT